MTIHVSIKRAEIVSNGLALTLTTTNTDYPGDDLGYSKVYDLALTPAQIQDQINAEVALLWQAHGINGWDVE